MLRSILALLPLFPAFALASSTVPLTPENTTVTFDVDSTWHTVEGSVHAVQGEIHFDEPGRFETARVSVTFPISGLDTGSERRDDRMREVLGGSNTPEIGFSGGPLRGDCRIGDLSPGQECRAVLPGTLRIHGHAESLELPVRIRREGSSLLFSAEKAVEWMTYGVEDPSILIARLDKTVRVHIHVKMPGAP